ncbi:hypothetical protein GSI_04028 [Ganoderma sinense ZZ0214-1]|uniref:EF-hand domain-containing protein n=1 Tax=Ganoderma sinense ZZ0214-1 TaxID=1077348 RepID=A0A2G8SI07_9APHY|nr:hypothetical protein GSI_04028 [Ganoderma sinense ZZ0214-1]
MAPENPTESSGGVTGSTNSREVDDAERALNMASVTNTVMQQPEKDTQIRMSLKGTTKIADTVGKDGGVNLLLDGVNSLVHSLPPLVKALDAVAQIHPFIAIAVGAFKVVIELEIKRRDNDKKVNLLFLEMRNMMSVLLELQSVPADHAAKDGKTIDVRLTDSVMRTANDIKECANVCDTYSKKRLLVKVLKGPIWDDTLKGFIQLFADRKAEFNFAIVIHTGMAIDRANDKLDALTTKMELILKFFERCVPPSQRMLNTFIEQAGGLDAALQSQGVLQTLIERERSFEHIPGAVGVDYYSTQNPYYSGYSPIQPHISGVAGIMASGRRRWPGFDYSHTVESQRWRLRTSLSQASSAESQIDPSSPKLTSIPTPPYPTGMRPVYLGPDRNARSRRKTRSHNVAADRREPEFRDESSEVMILRQELSHTPSSEIEKNLEMFERKFEIQTRELAEEMTSVVVHEGDRVISSVLAGPHDKIIDPDLFEVWKDMRWRGIVKARHLVLAMYDYYLQKKEDQDHASDQLKTRGIRSFDGIDAWTLEYIDLRHVQPIIEAFDEDTSGYVTIQEVNNFTTSRPQGWSLLHWMAYWAVGWRVCMTAYRDKILSTLDSMGDLLENILTPNRVKVLEYLEVVHPLVTKMVQSFQADTELLFLLPRFRAHMDQNEERLQKGLDTVKYQIDALDTLALINGRRGLERNVFPLLHLLLCRHYEIMKLGRIHILHPSELVDAQESLGIIQDAFQIRRNELSELFRQRRLSVPQELDDFAYGMGKDR